MVVKLIIIIKFYGYQIGKSLSLVFYARIYGKVKKKRGRGGVGVGVGIVISSGRRQKYRSETATGGDEERRKKIKSGERTRVGKGWGRARVTDRGLCRAPVKISDKR